MRVLVLDDNPLTAFTLARLFAIRGAQVVTVATAEAAERTIERKRFDALVVDAEADKAKGLRLLDRARRLDAGISLFALTDREPEPSGESDIYYIEKPCDGMFVVDLVRTWRPGERKVVQLAPGRSRAREDRPTAELRPKRRRRRHVRDSA
jgi:DNA-binding response OmpR family regulator